MNESKTAKLYLNKVFTNKYEQTYTVIQYKNTFEISVKFEDGTIRNNITATQIKTGRVLNSKSFKRINSLNPTYTNIGYMGIGKYNNVNNHKCVQVWQSMLQRCYCEKSLSKYPSYNDCTVDEKWHNFQNFAEWYYQNYVEGYHLDKDILIKGNKIYSEETCCFVPLEINLIFPNHKRARGKYPIGVFKVQPKAKFRVNKPYFKSLLSSQGNRVELGNFDTVEEAFIAYKTYKEKHIKFMALTWKSKITEKVFNALNNYTIDITD